MLYARYMPVVKNESAWKNGTNFQLKNITILLNLYSFYPRYAHICEIIFFSVSVHFEVVFSAVCLLANNLCHFCYSFYMLLTTCKLVHFTSQYFVHSFVHSVFIRFLLFIFLFMELFFLPPVISSIHSICECINVFQYELHSKCYLVCVRLCVNGCVPLGWVNAVAYAVCNMDFRSESHRIFIKCVTFFL